MLEEMLEEWKSGRLEKPCCELQVILSNSRKEHPPKSRFARLRRTGRAQLQ